jgi:hypothetical protein
LLPGDEGHYVDPVRVEQKSANGISTIVMASHEIKPMGDSTFGLMNTPGSSVTPSDLEKILGPGRVNVKQQGRDDDLIYTPGYRQIHMMQERLRVKGAGDGQVIYLRDKAANASTAVSPADPNEPYLKALGQSISDFVPGRCDETPHAFGCAIKDRPGSHVGQAGVLSTDAGVMQQTGTFTGTGAGGGFLINVAANIVALGVNSAMSDSASKDPQPPGSVVLQAQLVGKATQDAMNKIVVYVTSDREQSVDVLFDAALT